MVGIEFYVAYLVMLQSHGFAHCRVAQHFRATVFAWILVGILEYHVFLRTVFVYPFVPFICHDTHIVETVFHIIDKLEAAHVFPSLEGAGEDTFRRTVIYDLEVKKGCSHQHAQFILRQQFQFVNRHTQQPCANRIGLFQSLNSFELVVGEILDACHHHQCRQSAVFGPLMTFE